MEAARRLLVETKVKTLGALSGSTLTQLLDTNTVEQALQVLAENRILSAPVIAPRDVSQKPGSPAQGADIVGFVCVNDVLRSFLERYEEEFGINECCAGAASLQPPQPQQQQEAPAGQASPSSNGDGNTCGGAAASAAPTSGPTSGPTISGRVSSSGGGVSMLARMRQLEALGHRFAQQPLADLSCKGCDGDFLHSRHAGEATLLELVMYGFLDPKRRGMHEGEQQAGVVHRVALFDNTGTITSVISQSDIIRFLAEQQQRLGGLQDATIAELGWDRRRVVSCTPDTPALDAMRLMVAEGVSALAVVTSGTPSSSGPSSTSEMAGAAAAAAGASAAAAATPEEGEEEEEAGPAAAAGVGGGSPGGRLLGNFSASEMRTMTAEHFGALSLPVGEFLAHEHDTEYVALNRERMLEEGVVGSPAHTFIQNRLRRTRPHAPGEEVGQQLIVVTPEHTFGEVLSLLVRHRIHRLYVVDSSEVPRGVITCTDILRKVVEVATAPMSPASAARAGALRPLRASPGPPRGASPAAAVAPGVGGLGEVQAATASASASPPPAPLPEKLAAPAGCVEGSA